MKKAIKLLLVIVTCVLTVSCNSKSGGTSNDEKKKSEDKKEEVVNQPGNKPVDGSKTEDKPNPTVNTPKKEDIPQKQDNKVSEETYVPGWPQGKFPRVPFDKSETIVADKVNIEIGNDTIEFISIGRVIKFTGNTPNLFQYIRVKDKAGVYYLANEATKPLLNRYPKGSFLGTNVFKFERNWNLEGLEKNREKNEAAFNAIYERAKDQIVVKNFKINREQWKQNTQIYARASLYRCPGMNGWQELRDRINDISITGIITMDHMFFLDRLRESPRYYLVVDINDGHFLGFGNAGYSFKPHMVNKLHKFTCSDCSYFSKEENSINNYEGYAVTCSKYYGFLTNPPKEVAFKGASNARNIEFEKKFVHPDLMKFSSTHKSDINASYSDSENFINSFLVRENMESNVIKYLEDNGYEIMSLKDLL